MVRFGYHKANLYSARVQETSTAAGLIWFDLVLVNSIVFVLVLNNGFAMVPFESGSDV